MLVVAATAARAQVVIQGTLYNDSTGAPLRGSVMLVDPVSDAAVVHIATDSLGAFTLQGPAGRFRLAAVRPGFGQTLSAPIDFVNGERLALRIPLAETGDVKHRIGVREHYRPNKGESSHERAVAPFLSSGFAARRASQATGKSYDRAELENSEARTLGGFLQRVAGVRVLDPDHAASVAIRNPLIGSGGRLQVTPCHVGWFVDGHRMDFPQGVDGATDALAGMPLADIEAVEVFKGISEMPAEFAEPDLRCGAVAVWTRRGP